MRTKSPTSASTGQVSTAAAEVYENFFIPALFAQWADPILDAVGVREGQCLLDIGTGTGVVARAALRRVGPTGSVIAVDPNDGMLAVAGRLAPNLDVRKAKAEDLPFADNEVTCTTSQFAMMFFDDRERAAKEMARVTHAGGRVAVSTWAAVDESPGYAAMVDLLGELLGDWAAEALRAPFSIGTPDELADLLRPSFGEVEVQHRMGRAHFTSLDEWLYTDIRGWTLSDAVDDDQFECLRRAAHTRLSIFVDADGSVGFSAPALIATATVM